MGPDGSRFRQHGRRGQPAGWGARQARGRLHAGLAGVLLMMAVIQDGEAQTVVVRPEPSEEPLPNPGKGWVLMSGPAQKSKEAISLAGVGYTRIDWCALQPEEDKYDWTPIDTAIKEWSAHGKQFAFGVMAANSCSQSEYVTPKWVFKAGAPEVRATGVAGKSIACPQNYEHPVFMDKLGRFLAAMGERYDGNPRIAFVDIRSYGNWGEGHLGGVGGTPISKDGYLRHIRMHQQAFKKTRLVLPWGGGEYDALYDWAVTNSIGMRRDGVLGNSDGRELIRCFGKTPAVIEWYSSYAAHAGIDLTGVDEHFKKNYVVRDETLLAAKIEEQTERARATYENLGQWGKDSDLFLERQRPLIHKLTNRLGYHFVLVQAAFPKKVAGGAPVSLALTLENRGIAHIHIPAHVSMALLNARNAVVASVWLDAVRPAAWAPGKAVEETVEARLPKVPPGSYRLAVGIFQDRAGAGSPILLGNRGVLPEGWLSLGDTVVE